MKIELRNLYKQYDRDVLKEINFTDKITSLALIGRSGCGKSTLLRLIGGLIAPTQGQILLDGQEVSDTPDFCKKIGFVFQHGGLFSHLSAIDNITLPLIKVHGMEKSDAIKTAENLLDRFGLKSEQSKLPAQLSGGQRQRIAIARAVAPKPSVLLLDEPTSALDPEYTTEVLNMIEELKDENLCFIIATHEMGFAFNACEKVAFMSDGKFEEFGLSKELFNAPQTEELKLFLSKLLKWKV